MPAEFRQDFESQTSVGIGAPVGSNGVTAVERGNDVLHKTILTLTDVPITVRDAEQGGGIKIYDFPEGVINLVGASMRNMTVKTTSVTADTLNATASAGRIGVGTVTQANATLATTEQDIVPVTTFTPAAINVASTAVGNHLAATVKKDGHTTAVDAFLNISVPTATDIDANATVLVSGTVEITWNSDGDY